MMFFSKHWAHPPHALHIKKYIYATIAKQEQPLPQQRLHYHENAATRRLFSLSFPYRSLNAMVQIYLKPATGSASSQI